MASSQCCNHPPKLDLESGLGSYVDDFGGGVRAYLTGSPHSKAAILLASDAFGCDAPLLRKLADKVASAGFFVVVPDFFHGDPYNPDGPNVKTWLQKHPADKGIQDAKSVIETLRDKGISTIGAAGFCWGAKVVADLAKTDYIKAAVMLHPSLVTTDDIQETRCHIAILGAEIDRTSPPELVKQFEEILSGKDEINSFVKIYSGAEHGWAIRYDTENKQACQEAEEAQKCMLDWFVKYLK